MVMLLLAAGVFSAMFYFIVQGSTPVKLPPGQAAYTVDMMGDPHVTINKDAWYDPQFPDRWFCHCEHDGNGCSIGGGASLFGTETRPEIYCDDGDRNLYLVPVFGQVIEFRTFLPWAARP